MPIPSEPIALNEKGIPVIFCDWVIYNATAAKNVCVIKVTMNGGILVFATISLFSAPIRHPIASIITIVKSTATTSDIFTNNPPVSLINQPHKGELSNLSGLKDFDINMAPITLVKDMIEVWDKSMPPNSSTNVCPIAIASKGQIFDSILLTLCAVSIVGTMAAII